MSTTTGYKTPDKSIVQHYAEAIMNRQSNVTTLEVKNAMRGDNYWVDQKDVSKWLREVASDNNWDHSNATGPHGTYIVYSPSISASVGTTTTTTKTVTDGGTRDSGGGLESIITKLFGIHKFAMNDNSVIGRDLGLKDKLDLEELSSTIETKFGKDIEITADMSIADIKKAISSNQAAKPSGRVKVHIDPKHESKNGLTNDGLKDLIKDGTVTEDDWVLSNGFFTTRVVYAGSESRDHVRTAFARKVGVHINTTRASRVKNLIR